LYVDVGDAGYFVEEGTDALGWHHLKKNITRWPSIHTCVM